jgi:hypothetical protein
MLYIEDFLIGRIKKGGDYFISFVAPTYIQKMMPE